MDKKLYSTAEVGHILRVSRVEVFRRIKSGEIEGWKVGRNYVISQDAVLEVLGKAVGPKNKKKIDIAIRRAIKDYGATFKRLGKE